jgi:hypothetical protein
LFSLVYESGNLFRVGFVHVAAKSVSCSSDSIISKVIGAKLVSTSKKLTVK